MYRYLFSYTKYDTVQDPETWLIASTCFPIQNIKPYMYLRPGQSHLTNTQDVEA